MLDIGWSEMAIIAVIALFVIGPRELPRMLRTVGRYAGKIRGMAREFQDGIDEAVREAELDEVKKQIESAQRIDVKKSIEDAVDPERKIGKAMDFSNLADPKPAGNSARANTGETAEPEEKAGPPAQPAPQARRAQGMAASISAAAAPARTEATTELVETEESRADA